MSKGVLLFALNTEFRYTDLAEICAKRVKEFLKLPVSLVVNDNYVDSNNLFDKIIKIDEQSSQNRILNDGADSSITVKWLNFPRPDAYDLTPYDKTLVLDVDYIVNSSHLKICFTMEKDFLIFKEGVNLLPIREFPEFNNINPFSIKFYWATVFYFKKTKLNKVFFDHVKYIRDNWPYYCSLYQIKETKFRNDFAFSIGIHNIFSSRVSKRFGFVPGKLFYTIDRDILIESAENKMNFLVANNTDGKLQPVAVNNLDVHIMNKFSLLRTMHNE
jgi:hypothetical protein